MRVFKVYIWVCGHMYVYMCFCVCVCERERVCGLVSRLLTNCLLMVYKSKAYFSLYKCSIWATKLSITTFSIIKLSIKILGITTLSKIDTLANSTMTLSITPTALVQSTQRY
jgi:hypothetical protein